MTEDCIRGRGGVGERRRLGGETSVALAPILGTLRRPSKSLLLLSTGHQIILCQT